MELSLEGASIGISADRVIIRPVTGDALSIKLSEAEPLMLALRDAIQTADHMSAGELEIRQAVMRGSIFDDIENLISACEAA